LIIQAAGILALHPFDNLDSREYLSISGSLHQGTGYAVRNLHAAEFPRFEAEAPTRMRQPGYPFFLTFFYWMTGRKVLVVQLVQVLLNMLILWLTFRIARTVYGSNLWCGTLIIIGLYFPLWLRSQFILPETLFTLTLVLFMLIFLQSLNSGSVKRYAASGIVLGLAVLIKPIAVPFSLFALIPIWMKHGLRKGLIYWGALLVLLGATLLPWTVRNSIVFGEFTPLSTEGGFNLWCASVDYERTRFDAAQFREGVADGYYIDREADRRFRRMAVEAIGADPLGFIRRAIGRMVMTWVHFPGVSLLSSASLVYWLLMFIQLGLLALIVTGALKLPRWQTAYLLLPALVFTFVFAFIRARTRFVLPAMPLLLILAGQGGWNWLKGRFQNGGG